jgi:dTDP-4-amino-4,6-dideoxygalactose transaminase
MVGRIDFAARGKTRRQVMQELRALGVGTQVHYIPIHRQPYYRALNPDLSLPGAETYYSQCLSLPLYPDMVEADVDTVVAALAQVLGG